MTTGNIVPTKYVFLDIVAYSKHTVEAQCYLINTLNRIVKGAVNRYHVDDEYVVYIPTGDGICIALIGTALPYDVHVTIAKEILRRVWVNNSRVRYNWRKFEVRVGINQSDDNIVTDINSGRNVAGAGINNARRIMDLADGNQILVSSIVYDNLHPRKEYSNAFSREYQKEVKHGLVLRIHQLVQSDATGLNVDPPSILMPATTPEPKLTKLAAYYFAHSIKNEEFILNKAKGDSLANVWLKLLLWFLAKDSEKVSESSPYDIYTYRVMPDTGVHTIEGQFEWFRTKNPFEVAQELIWLTLDDAVPSLMQPKYFEELGQHLIINSEGKEKLKKDWPEIWNEFRLDELSA